jgi:hypothetical protein
VIFFFYFDPDVLQPQNIDWILKGDLGQHFIGWHAFRHDAWSWPLGWTTFLDNPVGIPISFTDSNPLLSIALKSFSFLLPRYFQFVGLWYLSCIILHYTFAYFLLNELEKDNLRCILGAVLLTLLPFVLGRSRHDTLLAQWLILATFYVFLFVKTRRMRHALFATILAVSIAVHPYFYPMCAVFVGLNLLRDVVGDWRHRAAASFVVRSKVTFASAIGPILVYGLVTFIPAFALGLFHLDSFGGKYGIYTMEPLAWFNPQNKSLVLGSWTIGPGQREGFQYLGLGNLILVAVAAGLTLVWKVRVVEPLLLALKWLLPGCVLLYLVALSPTVTAFGHVVIDLDPSDLPLLGQPATWFFGLFRSSGRLFWPGSLLLVIVALATVVAADRRWTSPLLAALILVQLADSLPLANRIRALTESQDDRTVFRAIGQPELWREILQASKRVVFAPTTHSMMNDRFHLELFLLAVPANVGFNSTYTSQWARHPKQKAFVRRDREQVSAGQFDDEQLYVLDPAYFRKTFCNGKFLIHDFIVLDGKVIRPPARFSNSNVKQHSGDPCQHI